jgi:hypothetical protein
MADTNIVEIKKMNPLLKTISSQSIADSDTPNHNSGLNTNKLPQNKITDNIEKKWILKEEQYLYELHIVSIELSKYYQKLYERSHTILTSLRIPVILLSSIAGLTSFGSESFPNKIRPYLSIITGSINVCIAMLQTYESYFKIGDTVTKCLAASEGLRKLSDDIHCEIFLPPEDRTANGIVFLRDAFTRYQSIMDQAPPLSKELIEIRGISEIFNVLNYKIKKNKLRKQLKFQKLKAFINSILTDKLSSDVINIDTEDIEDNIYNITDIAYTPNKRTQNNSTRSENILNSIGSTTYDTITLENIFKNIQNK